MKDYNAILGFAVGLWVAVLFMLLISSNNTDPDFIEQQIDEHNAKIKALERQLHKLRVKTGER